MKKFLLGLTLLTFLSGCEKEINESVTCEDCNNELLQFCTETNSEFQCITIDKKPEFINGGETEFFISLSKAMVYPSEARRNGIEGRVILTYEVTKEGTVENIVIKKRHWL
ncbi:TonB family protein [Xanthovirga aplysinae]|uniref:TonB family protein n=1 Tax=Xanthovirga aplysinae TaxID=2529853 RepID=UPI0012BC37B2|nr:TonB family protein [Xanthovirga aplysinae]